MSEYNLTWDEAILAMEKGAICKSAKYRKHRINKGNLQCFYALNWGLSSEETWNDIDDIGYYNYKWRIVEWKGCGHGCSCIKDLIITIKNEIQKKEKMKDFKFEEGKFYSWGTKDYIYKLENGIYYEFCKHYPNRGWDFTEVGINFTSKFPVPGAEWEEVENPEKSKEINLLDAVSGMKKGKFYKDLKAGEITRLENGDNFQGWNADCKWWEDLILKPIDFELKYVEVDNPEKKELCNELGLSEEDSWPNELRNFVGNNAYAKSDEIAKEWHTAMHTFRKLKAHPLAKQAKEYEEQFFIRIELDNKSLIVSSESRPAWKIDYISSFFDSYEDARQAISDIGEAKLIHMFKTFSGIYENSV